MIDKYSGYITGL